MAKVQRDQMHTEAINRAMKLAIRTRAKLLEEWGNGPMVQQLSKRQMRAKLERDPLLRQQMTEAVGPDAILELMLGEETKRALGVG